MVLIASHFRVRHGTDPCKPRDSFVSHTNVGESRARELHHTFYHNPIIVTWSLPRHNILGASRDARPTAPNSLVRMLQAAAISESAIHYQTWTTRTRFQDARKDGFRSSAPVRTQILCSISVMYSLMWLSIFRYSSCALRTSFSIFSFRSAI
jgi:hypothetical protein